MPLLPQNRVRKNKKASISMIEEEPSNFEKIEDNLDAQLTASNLNGQDSHVLTIRDQIIRIRKEEIERAETISEKIRKMLRVKN